jgi:Reverse transcriptase (RNA-dependent DNA polymerase)
LDLLDADISQYFDRIGHHRLLNLIRGADIEPELEHLLQLWTNADVWDGRKLRHLKRGIAQGSPISPLLANYFLKSFDECVEKSGNHLIRYADHFIVLCRSEPEAFSAKQDVCKFLGQCGLELNEAKTRVTSFAAGFHFVGVHFREAEAMIPWKTKTRSCRLVFLARVMKPSQLLAYRRPAEKQAHTSLIRRASSKVQRNLRTNQGEAKGEMAFIYVTQQGAVVRKS